MAPFPLFNKMMANRKMKLIADESKNIRFSESVHHQLPTAKAMNDREKVTEWQLHSALLAHHQQQKVAFKASFPFSMYRGKGGKQVHLCACAQREITVPCYYCNVH